MKTYAAETNGEAVMAFRAMDHDARDMVSDEDGDLPHRLKESSVMVGADGTPLSDGKSEIIARPPTEAEDESWRKGRDAEIESADAGELIDSELEEDFNDFTVYLLSVNLVGGNGADA
jgi:hypothetical protein